MKTCLHPVDSTRNELQWMLREARSPRLRTMRQFAEEEIVIPDGPYQGQRFNCQRQPFTAIWFDLCMIRRYNRKFAPGCTQSGKSLNAHVIPALYHLFELQENIIVGVPHKDMAKDKWREDFKPAIERTRYRELLPRTGAGSRGGSFDSITFRNGATMKIMSGGGDDKSRSGYTARVLLVTEVDGFDFAGEASREADKFTQLEARTLAHGENKCVYGECTVSIESGRIWTEYQNGTKTDLHLKCPHCKKYGQLEREHLTGWQDGQTEEEARQLSAFFCPRCGEHWTEDDRRQANLHAVPVHRGQSIDDAGVVTGEAPETRTLSFRWHAGHNFFYDAAYVGGEEWTASRAVDEENGEKKLRQFFWTLPHIPATIDATPLTGHGIINRLGKWVRGVVPLETEYLTLGCDIGKFHCHWVLIAFLSTGQLHIVDYGTLHVASEQYGEERAIMAALVEFRDVILKGWLVEQGDKSKDQLRVPDQVWVDSKYQTATIFQFCRESGAPFMPSQGFGVEHRTGVYRRQRKKTKEVYFIGEDYHIALDKAEQLWVAQVNADYWKSWVHGRLGQEIKQPGALTLFRTVPREHMKLARQLTAEKKVAEFVAGLGNVQKWIKVHRNNHYFDAAYNACCAGHFCGFELLIDNLPSPEPTT